MSVDKKISYDVQGGVKNYLGKQKEVKAPLKWQSSPNHPSTELAYITQAEKDLLVKQDLHGSLKGGVNRGPSGIMSLNGWGDSDGQGGSDTSGGNAGAEGGQGDGSGGYDSGNNDANPGDQDTFNTETGYQGTGGTTIGSINENKNEGSGNLYDEVALVSQPPIDPDLIEAIKEVTTGTLADPDEKKDFVGDTIFGPTQKYTGNNSLFGGANKYGYTDQYTDPTKTNFGDTKPGYGGKILGGLLGLATGVPFIGSAIGSVYDTGKGFFSKQPKDMSKFNNLGYGGTNPAYGFGVPTQQGDYDLLGNKINELTGEIISPTGDSFGFIPGYPEGPDSNQGGITTIIPEESSDQYVNLIEEFVPESTMPEDEELLDGFKSRFLQNRTEEEKKEIEKMINEKFKYDYGSFGLGDMDNS
jgi:hypothetical protein